MRCWGELKSLRGQSVGEVSTCNFQDMWKWKSARPRTSRKAGYAPAKCDFAKLFFSFHTFVPRDFKGFQFFVRFNLIIHVSLNSKWLLDGHTLQCGHNGLSNHVVAIFFKMTAHQGHFFLVPISVCVLFIYRKTSYAPYNSLRLANNFSLLKRTCFRLGHHFIRTNEKSFPTSWL